jgi:hypothetical protein
VYDQQERTSDHLQQTNDSLDPDRYKEQVMPRALPAVGGRRTRRFGRSRLFERAGVFGCLHCHGRWVGMGDYVFQALRPRERFTLIQLVSGKLMADRC